MHVLGKQKVEVGQPLKGYVKFKVPGLYAEGLPDHGHFVQLTMFVEDERGKRHHISDLWGPPLRPDQELEGGIRKRIREIQRS